MKKKKECFALVRSVTEARQKSLGKYRGWEVYSTPDEGISISSSEADELIEKYDMMKVLETEDGCIYDHPDKRFFKKYKGWFAEQERKEREKREKMKERCAQAREKKRKERNEARQQIEG